jgi:hypothetical protein
LAAGEDLLRTRPYGMIEFAHGRLVRVQLKPWPKIASLIEINWIRGWKNQRRQHDVCRLFYNQPIQHRNYLALTYIESSSQTRAATVLNALKVLDHISMLKRTDAILAEVSNEQISDRLMKRLGWIRHRLNQPKRHWIKRFYGVYPPEAKSLAASIEGDCLG